MAGAGVGLVLGPHALALFPESEATHLLSELGVVLMLVVFSQTAGLTGADQSLAMPCGTWPAAGRV